MCKEGYETYWLRTSKVNTPAHLHKGEGVYKSASICKTVRTNEPTYKGKKTNQSMPMCVDKSRSGVNYGLADTDEPACARKWKHEGGSRCEGKPTCGCTYASTGRDKPASKRSPLYARKPAGGCGLKCGCEASVGMSPGMSPNANKLMSERKLKGACKTMEA
eukprot:6031503-Pleurochrysis_carterae.AAC.1